MSQNRVERDGTIATTPPPQKKKSTPLEPYRRFGDISISALGIRAGWFSQSVSPTPDNCSSEKRVHPIRTPEKRAHVKTVLNRLDPMRLSR